jgi:ribosomal protein L36
LGLVSDIEQDGSLSELTEDEFKQVIEVYKQFIKTKMAALEKTIETDEELLKEYRSLKFTESVINGKAAVVAADPKDLADYKKVQANTALLNKSVNDQTKAINRAQVIRVANKSRKHKGRK